MKPMRPQTIQLEHGKMFLDVVFGVIIAFPLAETLPDAARKAITVSSLDSSGTILLLSASLIFSTLYWLEARRFVDEMDSLDAVVNSSRGVSVSRVLGGLLMVALVASVLKFADIESFRWFIGVNLAFWISDFVSSVGLKYRYAKCNVKSIATTCPEEFGWYTRHFSSSNFFLYAILNALFFAGVLILDLVLVSPSDSQIAARFRFIAAVLILALTIFRHLVWRVWLDPVGSGVTAKNV